MTASKPAPKRPTNAELEKRVAAVEEKLEALEFMLRALGYASLNDWRSHMDQ